MDRVLLFGRTFHLVGFTSVSAAGETVTGSAADMGDAPIARAYFELLERACVLDAVERAASEYGLRDATGRALGTCPSDVVFPREPPGAGFRYSLSNGVAAGRTWTDASAAALAELVERDRVLRSWFGESRPEPVPLPPRSIFAELASAYELRAYRFPSPGEDRSATTKALTAVGVFGFPRSPNFPLVYGLAAANSPQQALFRAQRECLQRLAFLWGEDIPEQEPTFSPSAAYHQEFYLWPAAHERLRRWLDGGSYDPDFLVPPHPEAAQEDRFVDLTPVTLRNALLVIKAIPSSQLPLTFGKEHPFIPSERAARSGLHPIA
ncbi:MAG TPA: YcaO-like family protein [Polyangiaceae bacterium]|nr:YcaO-like family protein [Polyangiaceae bacterium]